MDGAFSGRCGLWGRHHTAVYGSQVVVASSDMQGSIVHSSGTASGTPAQVSARRFVQIIARHAGASPDGYVETSGTEVAKAGGKAVGAAPAMRC